MPVSKVLEILRQIEAKGLVELTVENHHQYTRLKTFPDRNRCFPREIAIYKPHQILYKTPLPGIHDL